MSHPNISSFSVSWDAYQKTLCGGLSSLQQNGEFVDMTLAADGHLVRVHRMVMSLISPYIKQLIASADCSHPVIFLYNVPYKTLCSLLEYAYTGVVQVPWEELNALIEAGKALHIKGIGDMVVDDALSMISSNRLIKIQNTGTEQRNETNSTTNTTTNQNKTNIRTVVKTDFENVIVPDRDENDSFDDGNNSSNDGDDKVLSKNKDIVPKREQNINMQFTLSNQGKIQMVLNRYLYHLDYASSTGRKRWRCINRKRARCGALVITKNNIILKRTTAHNHPYHDDKILKKVLQGTIVDSMEQAEYLSKAILAQREQKRNEKEEEEERETDDPEKDSKCGIVKDNLLI